MAIAPTEYYHIYIVHKYKNKKREAFIFNFRWSQVKQTFAVPYMENRAILVYGRFVHPSDIDKIEIFESKKLFQKLILPNGKSPIDEKKLAYVVECFVSGKVKGVKLCTHVFITLPPEEKMKPIKVPTKPIGKKEKVFIVHGRDDKQALLLQKYLSNKLKVDAVMFDDLPDKGRTIIEQLEYIRDNIGYAFVIVTPDDLGCLREDVNKWITKLEGWKTVSGKTVSKIFETLNTRARQNVVFELGLFIGALGRDKVCCLLKQDTDEKPSDIDGILYKPFNKSVKEIFHEIDDELKENNS